jgi:hypothetical protein
MGIIATKPSYKQSPTLSPQQNLPRSLHNLTGELTPRPDPRAIED